MKLLQERISEFGRVRSNQVLDVSAFLNKQVDPILMEALGKDFAAHYKDYDFDAFVTVESSGIAPSIFAAFYAKKPLVILKKEDAEKDETIFVQQDSYSYTKNHKYYLTVQKEYIENKKLILIDDFLAMGSVATNVDILAKKANAKLVAIGICISKNFQDGYIMLRERGYDLYIQVGLKKLEADSNTIEFDEKEGN